MRPIYTANIGNLQEYIKSISSLPKFKPDMRSGAFPFITISRQAGAGGHTLAELILKEMERERDAPILRGWQMLDQEFCKKVVEDPKLKVSVDALLTEKFVQELEDYLSEVIVGNSPQIAVFHRIAEIVRTFAAIGKVIIVGRAGSFLSGNLPLGIHVRLVASRASRTETLMRQFNWSKEEAAKQVKEQDLSRAMLVKNYFNKNISDPIHYDMVFNTDRTPIPDIASFLVQSVKAKAERFKSLGK